MTNEAIPPKSYRLAFADALDVPRRKRYNSEQRAHTKATMSKHLPSVTSPPWSATAKRLVALGTVTAAFLFARQVDAAAWTTIIVAVVLSYLLSPVVTFFEHHLGLLHSYELRRTVAVLLTWVVVLGTFGLGVGLIVPATVTQLRQFANDLPALVSDTEQDLQHLLDREITVGSYTVVPWDELQKAFTAPDNGQEANLTTTLQNAVLSLANPALGLVGGAVSLMINLFFVLTMLFYLMRDGPLFVGYLVSVVPESYQGDVRRLLHELGLVWNAYLRGQLILSLAVACAVYLTTLILGLPQPLLLGLLAGFLEFIPNLGPALSQIPALLFALTVDSSTIPSLDAGLTYAIVVSLSYILIQNLEAIFLVPRILGHSLDLHPFVVLVAVLIGASVAGVLGVVLAAPSVATLRVLLRYLRGKLLDEETFPAVPEYAHPPRGLVYRLIRYWLRKRFPVRSEQTPEALPVPRRAATPSDEADLSDWLG